MASSQSLLQSADLGFGLTVLNTAAQQPVIYVGVAASLRATLVNNTGAAIVLRGAPAATLTLLLPEFVPSAGYAQLQVSPPAGWQAAISADPDPAGTDSSVTLTYTGPERLWGAGEALVVSLDNVLTNAPAAPGQLTFIPLNLAGPNVPAAVEAPLSLISPPRPGNAKLLDTLAVSLENQGAVYVSTPADPLTNTLFLNFKNIGPDSLCTASTSAELKPEIIVSFVYGNTSGALTHDQPVPADPAAADPLLSSAWRIRARLHITQSDSTDWELTNPDTAHEHPRWRLKPGGNNLALLGAGTGAHANLTVAFGSLVTFAPTGHTQMVVQLLNFRKDDHTYYDDEVVVLDMVKQVPPATRGLLHFSSPEALYEVSKPDDVVTVPLSWSLFLTSRIHLFTNLPGVAPVTLTYDTDAPLAYANHEIRLPAPAISTAVFITIQAFGRGPAFLNSMQFTVFIDSRMFLDAERRYYPVLARNGQLWMSQNLRVDNGVAAPYHEAAQVERFGRLYTAAEAAREAPAGWRVPTQQDWQQLFDSFGAPADAFRALADPKGIFQAPLAGYCDEAGRLMRRGDMGCFWTSTRNANGVVFAQLSGLSSTAHTANSLPPGTRMSVRYVKDL